MEPWLGDPIHGVLIDKGGRHLLTGQEVFEGRTAIDVLRQHLHEEPAVPNFGRPGDGPDLEPGMVLAIEPMVNAGTDKVEALDDGWTVVTQDRQLSAHFEHTVMATPEGPVVLTM